MIEPPASGQRPPLFRPEAAEEHWDVLESAGLMPRPPRHAFIIIGLVVTLFLGWGWFMARGAVPRIEAVPGYLEPREGVAQVRAPRAGVLSAMRVHEGQVVAAGDAVATLRFDEITESGKSVGTEISTARMAQQRGLEAQLALEGNWVRTEGRRLAAAIDAFERELEVLDRMRQTQLEQIAVEQQHADKIRTLSSQGVISSDEQYRRDMAVLAQQQLAQNGEREIAIKRSQLEAARVNLQQLPALSAERVRPLREALSNARQRLIEQDARRAITVRAPVRGRVAAVLSFAGSAVDSGTLLASVVAESSEMRARLFVPTRAIGNVREGQKVAIRYDAFPYQKYGTFVGRIASMSQVVILPGDIDRVVPVKLAEPAYELNVTLDRQSVAIREGLQFRLRPHMLLTAHIETERRPILAWIAESVLGIPQI
jgi:membrane fusion protein